MSPDIVIFHNVFLLPFHNVYFIQTAVASANRRTTVRFSELKQRRYWLPLMVYYFYRSISLNPYAL